MSAPIMIEGKDDLDQKLKDAGGKLVVMDFYADWCGPCRMIAPKFKAFCEQYTDCVFLKINVDDNAEVAGEYEVQGIPLFVFVKNGQKVDSFSGANENKLKEAIEKNK